MKLFVEDEKLLAHWRQFCWKLQNGKRVLSKLLSAHAAVLSWCQWMCLLQKFFLFLFLCQQEPRQKVLFCAKSFFLVLSIEAGSLNTILTAEEIKATGVSLNFRFFPLWWRKCPVESTQLLIPSARQERLISWVFAWLEFAKRTLRKKVTEMKKIISYLVLSPSSSSQTSRTDLP